MQCVILEGNLEQRGHPRKEEEKKRWNPNKIWSLIVQSVILLKDEARTIKYLLDREGTLRQKNEGSHSKPLWSFIQGNLLRGVSGRTMIQALHSCSPQSLDFTPQDLQIEWIIVIKSKGSHWNWCHLCPRGKTERAFPHSSQDID